MERGREPSAAAPATPQEERLVEGQGSPAALEHLLQDAYSRAAASGAHAEQLHEALHEQQLLLDAMADRAVAAERAAAEGQAELQQTREQLQQARQEAELATGWVRQLAQAVEQATRQAAAAEAAAADRCEQYQATLAALGVRLGDMQGQLRAAEGRTAESEQEAATLRQWLQAVQQRLAVTEAALLGQQQLQQHQEQAHQEQHRAAPPPPPPQGRPGQAQPLAVALAMLPGIEQQLRMHAGDAQADAGPGPLVVRRRGLQHADSLTPVPTPSAAASMARAASAVPSAPGSPPAPAGSPPGRGLEGGQGSAGRADYPFPILVPPPASGQQEKHLDELAASLAALPMVSGQEAPARAAAPGWPAAEPAGIAEEAATGGLAGSLSARELPPGGPLPRSQGSGAALRPTARTFQLHAAAPGLQPEQHQQAGEEEDGQPEEGWEAGREEGSTELAGWEQERPREEEAWEEAEEEEEGWGPPEEAVPGRGPAARHGGATALRPTAQPFVPSWASR